MQRRTLFFAIRLSILFVASLGPVAQPGAKDLLHPLSADPQPSSELDDIQGRFASADGRALNLYAPGYRSRAATPDAMALEFIHARASQLGLDENASVDYQVTHVRDDGAFSVVRLVQTVDGLPVYGSDIAITVKPDGTVIFVSSEARTSIGTIASKKAVGMADIRARVKRSLDMEMATDTSKPRLVAYADESPARLAWVFQWRDPRGGDAWEIVADATNGDILEKRSTLLHVDGGGMVFHPDPLTSAMAGYGEGGYVDANDADSPDLQSQQTFGVLKDIKEADGVYSLDGPWTYCVDFDPPSSSDDCPAALIAPEFIFTRADAWFEAVNAYHHIDAFMRYLNDTLGVEVIPNSTDGRVGFDPHGANGDDNSYFDSAADLLSFGEGGVDDAEDADVVIHELGHGIHDWVTNGGLSQVQGLSEGTGDYLASSYNRSFDRWTSSDPQYYWMFHWDGHNEYWSGRVTNWHLTHSYPNNLGTGIHAMGQYWSSCNLIARDAIGRNAMDTAVLRGLAMTTASANQKVAAQAVVVAAEAMDYSFTEVSAILSAYNEDCTYGVSTDRLFWDDFEL